MRVVGQAGHELVLEGITVLGLVVVQNLDLHFGHVHAGRAVALATLATYT